MATEKAKGVDVSKWQGSIDWKQVKASGVDFAMIRLGRGEYDGGPCALDTCFKQNIAGALGAGLDVGVYFYSYALTAAKAKAEAEFVVNELAAYKGSSPTGRLRPRGQLPGKPREGRTLRHGRRVRRRHREGGYYAALYSNLNWLNNNTTRRRSSGSTYGSHNGPQSPPTRGASVFGSTRTREASGQLRAGRPRRRLLRLPGDHPGERPQRVPERNARPGPDSHTRTGRPSP
jgi:hypothetical protein